MIKINEKSLLREINHSFSHSKSRSVKDIDQSILVKATHFSRLNMSMASTATPEEESLLKSSNGVVPWLKAPPISL